MRRAAVLIAAILSFVLCSSQAGSVTFPDLEPGEYALTGRIVDTVPFTPACGYFAFAVAVNMEIISYSDTSYKRGNIVVVYCCPDFRKDNYFQVGKVHSVVLQNTNPASFGWAIVNEERLGENQLPYDLYVTEYIQ